MGVGTWEEEIQREWEGVEGAKVIKIHYIHETVKLPKSNLEAFLFPKELGAEARHEGACL